MAVAEEVVALGNAEIVDDAAVERDDLNDLVVDEHSPTAVEDSASWGFLKDLLVDIGLGTPFELLLLCLETLQVPEASDQPPEQHDRDEGEHSHSQGGIGHRWVSADSAHTIRGATSGARTALMAPTSRATTTISVPIRPLSPTIEPRRA